MPKQGTESKKKVPQHLRDKDWRVRVNSIPSEPELTHGVCIEFIWLGTGMIFSVKNQEVKNGMVICAWQKLRAFPWGPLPPCWPQGSLFLSSSHSPCEITPLHSLFGWHIPRLPWTSIVSVHLAQGLFSFLFNLPASVCFCLCACRSLILRRSTEAGKSSARSRFCTCVIRSVIAAWFWALSENPVWHKQVPQEEIKAVSGEGGSPIELMLMFSG